jgi:hypothetical protein
MAQTKNYQICNYSIMSGVTVTYTTGNSYNLTTSWNIWGLVFNYHTEGHVDTFSIPSPLPTDLVINQSSWSKTIDKGITTWDGRSGFGYILPAGQTSVSFSAMTYTYLITPNINPPDPSYTSLYQWQSGTTLDNQQTLPIGCTAQPSGCTIQTSGVTINPPTNRGDNDGSIVFAITGNTGTTITWKINGVTDGVGNTPHTFSGLTAGFYTIIAYEGFCYAQEADVVLPDGQFFTQPFITGSPVALTAANNPIVLQLQTAINSPLPKPAKSRLNINNVVAIDTTITFNITYPQVYTATFTAKGFPDSNIKFLATNLTDQNGIVVGTNSADEIATSIAECLQQDIVLRRLYYITNNATDVLLTARENTPNLNLTTAQVSISNVGIQLLTDQLGASNFEGQLSGNYSLYTEVYVNPDLEFGNTPVEADFIRVGELQIPYQKDNLHKFQVETILKNFVQSTPPDFTFTGFTTLPDYDCAYFLKYGEIFPLIANSQTKKKRYKGKSTFLTTCNAALNFEDANDMTGYLGTRLTGLTATNGTYPLSGITWLTNSPQTLYVQRNSKQYLSFLLQRNYASSGRTLSCNGDIYFYNGTVITGVTFFQITSGITTNFGGLTMLAVGYDALGLAGYENSGNTKVRRVDFSVYNNDSNGSYPLTEVKTFLYEIDEQPLRFGVAFLNKFGCWDIFDFVGEVVSDEDITRENYQVPRQINPDGSSPKGFIANSVYNTQYVPKWTLNSGTIDALTYEWLQELLESNRVYSYTNQHQNFLIVTSYTANKSTNVNEYTLQLILSESIGENNVAT